jgi:all-trans-retinol 13,14-reductase
MSNVDVIIIGSGLGGLVSGSLLSSEGYKVCILEKNRQIGGCLQTYVRDRVIFDSGVHYIGGLDKGQTLYQIFKYLGLMDKLQLQKMNVDAFDKILLGNDDTEYALAQGYDNFIEKLLVHFPDEEKAIRQYCQMIMEVCSKFPLYNLRTGGGYHEKAGVLEIDTKAYIESLTDNVKLQGVLAGNNALYAGQPGKTPFYVHALILNHYIISSWKCVNGGSQIAKHLAINIRRNGGEIRRNCEVKKIIEENGRITCVELADGSFVYGSEFISNIHPVKTLEMTDTELIRNTYRKRLKSLENSISSFTVSIVLKKDCFPYINTNYYYHSTPDVWNDADYTEENWPLGYALFFPASSKSETYADAVTILAYMRYDEVKQWEHTFNTVSAEDDRGSEYMEFKNRKAGLLIDLVEKKFPGLKNCIQSYYTATPLSYRDYIGNDDGSLYGIVKDFRDPLKTFISPRTKLPNLYLTGQNLNLHGILGAAISGLVTSAALMGSEHLIEKIRNA